MINSEIEQLTKQAMQDLKTLAEEAREVNDFESAASALGSMIDLLIALIQNQNQDKNKKVVLKHD